MQPLTEAQQQKVEENMGLVWRVIHDCVHTLGKGCIYDREDLYQIGCIGLCKAVQADKGGRPAAFSTFAYCVIRNEIYTQLEYATLRGRELAVDPDKLPCATALDLDSIEQLEACSALYSLLDRAEKQVSGVTGKGVCAIRMLMAGYTNREIGERFGVPANHVTAWVTKARKYLATIA